MRLVYTFRLVGDDEPRTVTTTLGDAIKAERKFKQGLGQIVSSESVEPLAWILHSRCTHLAARGDMAPVPVFDSWIDGDNEGALEAFEVDEVLTVKGPTRATS